MSELSIDQALTAAACHAHIGDHRSAVGLCRAVVEHEPNNDEALGRLGSSLFELGQFHEALFCFWRARKANKRNLMALMNYGLTLSQLGFPEEGLEDIERAVRMGDKLNLSPRVRAIQYNNLGNTLERLGRHPEALIALDKGIALDPEDDFPHYNRGITLLRLNRHEEAKAALHRSIELKDKNDHNDDRTSRLNLVDSQYNLSMAHLPLGEFKEGFAAYEYRLTNSEQRLPNYGLPARLKWTPGESIEGKRLLIHGEQGLGDAIHMLRFLPWLKAQKPAEILFAEHDDIKPLLANEPVKVMKTGESLLVSEDEKLKQPDERQFIFDRWVALMSLPHYFGIEREDQMPPPLPVWEAVDNDRLKHWKSIVSSLFPDLPGRPTVAFCWAGNFKHKNDKHRSIPLEKFATLFDEPCNFVSVQQMRHEDTETFKELRKRYANVKALYTTDFRDCAAILLNCDLMVTADTSVAHLSGSLGIPTWVFIPKFSTDWRWMLDRTDSPWYPSMRLIRQDKIGDWMPALQRVKGDLNMLQAGLLAA